MYIYYSTKFFLLLLCLCCCFAKVIIRSTDSADSSFTWSKQIFAAPGSAEMSASADFSISSKTGELAKGEMG